MRMSASAGRCREAGCRVSPCAPAIHLARAHARVLHLRTRAHISCLTWRRPRADPRLMKIRFGFGLGLVGAVGLLALEGCGGTCLDDGFAWQQGKDCELAE